VSLGVDLEAAGRASFAVGLRLLLGRHRAGGDKSTEHRQEDGPAEGGGHGLRIAADCAEFQAREGRG
jgi:hypothetical protein